MDGKKNSKIDTVFFVFKNLISYINMEISSSFHYFYSQFFPFLFSFSFISCLSVSSYTSLFTPNHVFGFTR